MKLVSIIIKIINFIYSYLTDTKYHIGIIPHSDEILKTGNMPKIKWLTHHYKDRWFADPFIIDEDINSYKILVETYFYNTRKGVIGLIIADKESFRLKSYKTILDLKTHLSFPNYYYDGNKNLYVYPENSASGYCKLYKFNYKTEVLELESILCDLPLIDAAFITQDRKLMTATISPNGNGSECHILSKNGNKYSDAGIIYTAKNTARGAGNPFLTGSGKLIRPAQNCNKRYGAGLVFQEIQFNNNNIYFKEINRVYPNDKKYNAGLHTYNKFGNIAIVDGYYEPNKYIANLIRKLAHLGI